MSQPEVDVWLADLFRLLDLPGIQTDDAEVFLWRRIPHPDTLVPGGSEIDVGILTANALILGQAKWQSGVGAAQGKMRDKDQIQLRSEFLKKYGPSLFPNCTVFVVLGISLFADAFKNITPQGIMFRSTTWENICAIGFHPHAEQLWRWKMEELGSTLRSAHLTSVTLTSATIPFIRITEVGYFRFRENDHVGI